MSGARCQFRERGQMFCIHSSYGGTLYLNIWRLAAHASCVCVCVCVWIYSEPGRSSIIRACRARVFRRQFNQHVVGTSEWVGDEASPEPTPALAARPGRTGNALAHARAYLRNCAPVIHCFCCCNLSRRGIYLLK